MLGTIALFVKRTIEYDKSTGSFTDEISVITPSIISLSICPDGCVPTNDIRTLLSVCISVSGITRSFGSTETSRVPVRILKPTQPLIETVDATIYLTSMSAPHKSGLKVMIPVKGSTE